MNDTKAQKVIFAQDILHRRVAPVLTMMRVIYSTDVMTEMEKAEVVMLLTQLDYIAALNSFLTYSAYKLLMDDWRIEIFKGYEEGAENVNGRVESDNKVIKIYKFFHRANDEVRATFVHELLHFICRVMLPMNFSQLFEQSGYELFARTYSIATNYKTTIKDLKGLKEVMAWGSSYGSFYYGKGGLSLDEKFLAQLYMKFSRIGCYSDSKVLEEVAARVMEFNVDNGLSGIEMTPLENIRRIFLDFVNKSVEKELGVARLGGTRVVVRRVDEAMAI